MNSLFPLKYMNISQGSGGSFSHGGTKAIDYLGWDANGRVLKCPYYAPFDCTCTYKSSDGAGVGWTSDSPVKTPSGTKNITVVFYHDDNARGFTIGEKRKQGALIGHTGIAGNVTGDHVHIEIFLGNAYASTSIENWEAFYIDGTVIINDLGYAWKKGGSSGVVITPIVKDGYLTHSEMLNNAQYIAYYLTNEGWSKHSISGMLGNMSIESTVNPGLHEVGGGTGFGLVQWTPGSILTNWADSMGLPSANMDTQLKRILYELVNGGQWYATSGYPLTFAQFILSTEAVDYLTWTFARNYERPAEWALQDSIARRIDFANECFSVLDWSGNWSGGGDDGNGTDKDKVGKALIHMLLSNTLRGWG